MHCCDSGGSGTNDAEDLAVFASQITAAGLTARVHVRSVPAGLNRNARFDLAPYLFDGALGATDRLVLTGAQRLTDATLARLRRMTASAPVECLAFGAFDARQGLIGATAKLAYACGAEPRLFELPGDGELNRGLPVFGIARERQASSVPRVLLAAPDLQDAGRAASLISLSLARGYRVAVLTDGKSKHDWTAAHGRDIAFYHFGEILPADLAARVDVCVVFTSLQHNYRLQSLVANLAVSGAALIDATPGHMLARDGDGFIRGPSELAALDRYLGTDILPNATEIGARTRASDAARRWAAAPVLEFLVAAPAAAPAPRSDRPKPGPAGVVFMPTNGIGLGHAQRCTLIAAEMDVTSGAPVFAAFPSCTGLIRSRGFDVTPLVPRSGQHAHSHENDLPNFLRLRALADGAATLVFDGGYVFDSVYRTIIEKRLKAVWIRRGLWQAGQDNSVALDREKAFDRVIVPGEAFDELNLPYSQGDQLRAVGPIVQRIALDAGDRSALRGGLSERFDRDFDRLVVSLLGAGVAADRGAQVQALCGMLERRSDVLHLVLVWPGAALQPAWFGWTNSRIVRTRHAGVLSAAADLAVGAAGYNAFHEMLYNGVPTIFVPQTGTFMDDQVARARAASERGLAGLVEPDALMALEREVGRFLDGGAIDQCSRAIAAQPLPEPGNAAAARLIEEVTHERPTLERDPVAHLPARRR